MKKKGIGLILILLSLSTMACRFSFELPWDVGAPDVEISPEEVAVAATRAAEVAATAASVADQAGQIAATAVLQGDDMVSTAVAGENLTGAAGAMTALERKLTSITPDANGNFTITMTDADLAEYMALQGAAFENPDARIENVQVNFTPQHVIVTGNVTKPVSLPLTAELRPVAVDGRLQFQVINASAGVLPIPESMLSVLEAGVNVGLGQALSYLPAEMTLLDVALGSGSMTVLGQVN
jgi:hypothetical protein